MSSTEVEDIIEKFNKFTQKPLKFLTVQEDVKDGIKNLVKSVYDFTKSQEKSDKTGKKSALPSLIVDGFDEEQIWQQIELQNAECWDNLVWEVANCISDTKALEFPVEVSRVESDDEKMNEDEPDEEMVSDNEQSHSSGDEELQDEPKKRKSAKKGKGTVKSSIVDDKFFKLQEMEQFLLKEEKKEGKKDKLESDDESIDMFEDIDDEDSEAGDDGKDMMYNDFFAGQDRDRDEQEEENDEESQEAKIPDDDSMDELDQSDEEVEEDEEIGEEEEVKKVPKNKEKKVKFAGLSSDDSDSDGSDESDDRSNKKVNGKTDKEEKKSDFELRQERLQQTISRLEEKTLKEAPWQLKGEVDANKRPQNSLLQEVVDFDLTTRPPPIITEQTTITLEEIIRQRIKDKAWDDVVRKEKPVDDQLSFRKTQVLDQSKSELSLAQVYEAEYLKQKQKLSGDIEEEKEPEAHTQIREAMANLFSKLDALCHYHYTPKAPQAEVKIVSNTPAISMEEVAPVATSDAALLAPEEVKRKRRGDLMSKEERTQTDKNRERRKKKKLQKQKAKVTSVTEHRNTSKGVENQQKSIKNSKEFFQQLNDDTNSIIKPKNKHFVKNKG